MMDGVGIAYQDKIIAVLADGKPRTIHELFEELNRAFVPSLTKLGEVLEVMVASGKVEKVPDGVVRYCLPRLK
jgi:hypothetical protein